LYTHPCPALTLRTPAAAAAVCIISIISVFGLFQQAGKFRFVCLQQPHQLWVFCDPVSVIDVSVVKG
jgi:hypothetical protein